MAIIAIFMSVNLISCSSDDTPSNRLVGIWSSDDWDSRGKSTYNFKSNGTYTYTRGAYYSESGRYTYQHPLWTETVNGGGTYVYTIITFEKDYFVVMTNSGSTSTFYRDKEEEEEEQVVSGTSQNHDYVDLGLSVKWATCNIGATKPEDSGDCFLWGETTNAKCEYEEEYSEYKWYMKDALCGKSGYSKYLNEGDKWAAACLADYNHRCKCRYGLEDDCIFPEFITTLLPEDDAATAKWGKNWRMPTKEEVEELINKCTWTFTRRNGYNGYKITGRNGNSIFLPTAPGDDERKGEYWSSTLSDGNSWQAKTIYFYGDDYYVHGAANRETALFIRPVLK